MVKSLANIYYAVRGLAELLLNNVEEPSALSPEGGKQALNMFKLKGRLEQPFVNLQYRRGISTSVLDIRSDAKSVAE